MAQADRHDQVALRTHLFPLDRRGIAAARLQPLLRTKAQFIPRRLAYGLRAPWLSASRRFTGLDQSYDLSSIDDTIFILGYWRSGTTLLHELLSLDDRLHAPTTTECFNPQSFMLVRSGSNRTVRPMDAMAVSADSPQEDEFAIAGLGAPSPYHLWLRPSRMRSEWQTGIDLDSKAARDTWVQTFASFASAIRHHAGKRLLLKSPPHSYRIRLLSELLPRARFIYVVRDPREVFPSAVRMFTKMLETYAIEPWLDRDVEDYVIRTRVRLAEVMRDVGDLLAARRLGVVKFEKLIADPVGSIQNVLAVIEEGGSSTFHERLAAELKRSGRYERKHRVDDIGRSTYIAPEWAHLLGEWTSGRLI